MQSIPPNNVHGSEINITFNYLDESTLMGFQRHYLAGNGL